MPLRLFDSFQRRKLDFTPLVPGQVGIYLCGPTVQNSPHIGHVRTALAFDVVRRYLTWSGVKVTFVRNVTDIDDKIIARSKEFGEDVFAFGARYADDYNRVMTLIDVLPPDIEPRVTKHIPNIVAIIETLIARGMAYESSGDVYFAVEKFAAYGQLSGQSIDDLQAGARIEPGELKRNPMDFALWKAEKPGEPSWPSPWGKGRPGWHIECSAMCIATLGDTFDIHGGGKDLVFPHHENEIAQSQGATGPGTFAKFWMHAGLLNLNEGKMSKSLGNVVSVDDVVARHAPEALRIFYLATHYRSPLNFEVADREGGGVSYPGVEDAERRLDYFYTTLGRIDDFLGEKKDVEAGAVVPEAEALRAKFIAAMEDDFNAALAIAELGEAAKAANKLLDEAKSAPKDVRRRSLAKLGSELRACGSALGLLGSAPREFLTARRTRLAKQRSIDPAAIDARLKDRDDARKAKDFARADAIRDELTRQNVEVMDTPRGAEWRIKD